MNFSFQNCEILNLGTGIEYWDGSDVETKLTLLFSYLLHQDDFTYKKTSISLLRVKYTVEINDSKNNFLIKA